jgi:hypothetical protein
MPIDKHKKRIVFLTHDQILNLSVLAKMHLDANGAPKALQKYPVSDDWAETLRESIKVFDKTLEEIWKEEE